MTPSAAKTRTLSTAEERREDVLAAAERVFAAKGFHGTPTMDVARAAGISQAYLFRLFPTKADLAITLVKRCNQRVQDAFTHAADAADERGDDVLEAMGLAYVELIRDRDVLLLQLHGYASSVDDPAIRTAMRAGIRDLVKLVQRRSGAGDEEVQRFFATGMLLNMMGALGVLDSKAEWVQTLCAVPLDEL